MGRKKKTSFEDLEQKEFIRIAKELKYPSEVIERLKQSKNSNEASRIMTTERLRLLERGDK